MEDIQDMIEEFPCVLDFNCLETRLFNATEGFAIFARLRTPQRALRCEKTERNGNSRLWEL